MPVPTTCIARLPQAALRAAPGVDARGDVEAGEAEAAALTADEKRAALRPRDAGGRGRAGRHRHRHPDPTARCGGPTYIHYHCSHLQGFEPDTPHAPHHAERASGPPRCPPSRARSRRASPSWCATGQVAQAATERAGQDHRAGAAHHRGLDRQRPARPSAAAWCADLADALQRGDQRGSQRRAAAHIQVDEPLFARLPDQALRLRHREPRALLPRGAGAT